MDRYVKKCFLLMLMSGMHRTDRSEIEEDGNHHFLSSLKKNHKNGPSYLVDVQHTV